MYTLYHGDCLEVLPTIPSGSIDAVITDPPYPKLQGHYDWNWREGIAPQIHSSTSVGTPWGGSLAWTDEVWRVAKRAVIVFCSYQSLSEVRIAFPLAHPIALLTWYKRNAPPRGRNVPRHTTEFIWVLKKDGGLKWDAIKNTLIDVPMLQSGCMATERVRNPDGSTAHPTQKPLEVMRRILAIEPESVLDPFMGSGTTGVACAMERRDFIGVELDAGYYDIAKRRIEQVQPVLMEAAD